MVILNNGNVGIGTTSPNYTLTVAPNGGTAATTALFQDQTPTTGKTLVIVKAGAGNTYGNKAFSVQNSAGTEILSVDTTNDLINIDKIRPGSAGNIYLDTNAGFTGIGVLVCKFR